VSCSSTTSCATVGELVFLSAPSFEEPQPYALELTTSGWVTTAVGEATSAFPEVAPAVSCTAPANCVAVASTNGSPSDPTTMVDRWNGQSWQPEPTPVLPNQSRADLTAVDCTATGPCTSVGSLFINQLQIPFAQHQQ
jgi:hypothetical protein